MGALQNPTISVGVIYIGLASILPILGTVSGLARLRRREDSVAAIAMALAAMALILITVVANSHGVRLFDFLALGTMRLAASLCWLLVEIKAYRTASS